MILKCIEPFGNFVPGDEVEMPDGAIFDHFYFAEATLPETKKAETKTPDGGDK